MIPVIQLIKQQIEINPSCKVLKKQDYIKYLDGLDIIEAANNRAAEIIEEAQREYELQQKKGYEDGLTESKINQVEQNMEFVKKTISYIEEIETTLADILVKGIKKIIGDFGKEKVALNLVKNILKNVRNEKQIKIRIPNDEYDYVNDHIQEIMTDYKTVQFIDLIPDPRLKTGDCILESELGVIDASIDIQIEALKRQFSKIKHTDLNKKLANKDDTDL